jgi:hypothetical protein
MVPWPGAKRHGSAGCVVALKRMLSTCSPAPGAAKPAVCTVPL